MNLSCTFSREELKAMVADVRKHMPAIKVNNAWVYRLGPDHWEFHYKDFYWHGSADNAYDARAKGWAAILEQAGIEGYRRD